MSPSQPYTNFQLSYHRCEDLGFETEAFRSFQLQIAFYDIDKVENIESFGSFRMSYEIAMISDPRFYLDLGDPIVYNPLGRAQDNKTTNRVTGFPEPHRF